MALAAAPLSRAASSLHGLLDDAIEQPLHSRPRLALLHGRGTRAERSDVGFAGSVGKQAQHRGLTDPGRALDNHRGAAPPSARAISSAATRRSESCLRIGATARRTSASLSPRYACDQERRLGFFFTFQRACAGVVSTLPAGSVARTANVCLPGFSFFTFVGEVHGLKSAASRLQAKLAVRSAEENSNVAVLLFDLALGPLSISVSGGGGVGVEWWRWRWRVRREVEAPP